MNAEVVVLDVSGISPSECVRQIHAAQAAGRVPVAAMPGVAAALLEEAARVAGLWAAAAPGDPLMVLPTSGSTAAPRALLRTASSWTRSFAAFSAETGIGPGDVAWVPGGAGSTMALFAAWHARACGLDVVATGPWRGVPAAGAIREASVVQCVPTVLEDVIAARERGGVPRLRLAVVAGGALTGELRRRALATGLDVVEYYGAAETSFVAIGRDGLRPFPGVEVRSAETVLWCRSPYLALAGLGEQGSFRLDPDGWASVGDRGIVDGDGVLRVHGRNAGLLVGGHVVMADDVERVLREVPGVLDVVCLGRPDPRLGEHVVAVVRLALGAGAGPGPACEGSSSRQVVAALRAAARRGLPSAARPRRFIVAEDLPRTDGGKVARAVLARSLGLRLPSAGTSAGVSADA